MGKKIFISYATKDERLFQIPDLAEYLKKNSEIEDVYYCTRDSKVNFVDYMNEKIEASDLFLIFCTPNSKASNYVSSEWKAAFTKEEGDTSHIIPVFLDKKDIPELLKPALGVQYNVFDPEKSFEQIETQVLERLQVRKGTQSAGAISPHDAEIVRYLTNLAMEFSEADLMYIIHASSGNTLGFLRNKDNTSELNADLIAGFLTALGSFVEEVFPMKTRGSFFLGSNEFFCFCYPVKGLLFCMMLKGIHREIFFKEKYAIIKNLFEKIGTLMEVTVTSWQGNLKVLPWNYKPGT
jgi:hypothetical protein